MTQQNLQKIQRMLVLYVIAVLDFQPIEPGILRGTLSAAHTPARFVLEDSKEQFEPAVEVKEPVAKAEVWKKKMLETDRRSVLQPKKRHARRKGPRTDSHGSLSSISFLLKTLYKGTPNPAVGTQSKYMKTPKATEKKLKKDTNPVIEAEISIPAKISQEPIEDPEEDVVLHNPSGLIQGGEIPLPSVYLKGKKSYIVFIYQHVYSDLLAEFKQKVDRFFLTENESSDETAKTINKIPPDSALAEIRQCIKLYETTVYLCDILNFTSLPLSAKVAVMALKGTAKEGQKVLLRSPRLIELRFEFLDLPMVITKWIEEVKRGKEYEIIIAQQLPIITNNQFFALSFI
eukprot:TRINITY_DN980_c0_g1_i3.p1 TRINITY_DN980_c0_g1~~TRINITY_DN980_c0_g1_i3.p1  ORF type:complete len:345 (+),score=18.43 TRINITY_DN980_c0_g1_i3:295-1329(+)